ncbi:hypothetical protein VIGAN_04423100, partial [Vigna angularis var. angularis]
SLKTKIKTKLSLQLDRIENQRFPIKSQTWPSLSGNVDFGHATVSFSDPETNGYNTINWKNNTIKWKVIFLMLTKI